MAWACSEVAEDLRWGVDCGGCGDWEPRPWRGGVQCRRRDCRDLEMSSFWRSIRPACGAFNTTSALLLHWIFNRTPLLAFQVSSSHRRTPHSALGSIQSVLDETVDSSIQGL